MIKIIGHVANLLFLTLAIYFAVDAGYALFRGGGPMPPPPVRTLEEKPLPVAHKNHSFAYYQLIIERDLFHTRKSITPEGPVRPTDLDLDRLAKTQLQLKLWGTVASPQGAEASYAVIESEKDHKQHLYRVGDTVAGATVKMILRDKVILTRNGRNEVLEIEKPGKTHLGMPLRFTSRVGPAPGSPGVSIIRRRITLSRNQINTTMNNVGQLMQEAKIQPVRSGGTQGLVISQIRPNSLFRRLGLRNGDIITEVNGRTIQSVDDALQLYSQLKASNRVSLAIKRSGRNELIEYRIR